MTVVNTESFMTADRDRWYITARDGHVWVDISPTPEESQRLTPAEATQLGDFLRNAADSFRNPDEIRVELIDAVAQCIRVVDGSHSLGAGALATDLVDMMVKRGLL